MSQKVVSAFVESLWTLVSRTPPDVGAWSTDGLKFEVKKRAEFENLALTTLTCNWKTFTRQLHFYGFSKTDCRGRVWSFSHEYFQRDREDLLHLMKRSTMKPAPKSGGGSRKRKKQDPELEQPEITRLKAELSLSKQANARRMENLEKELRAEIELLRGEVANLRKGRQEDCLLGFQDTDLSEFGKATDDSASLNPFANSDDGLMNKYQSGFDSTGFDKFLAEFEFDQVPKPISRNCEPSAAEMHFIVGNKRIKTGLCFYAAIISSFVSSAEQQYRSRAESVVAAPVSLGPEYPLLKLGKLLDTSNPVASNILRSSLVRDELLHEVFKNLSKESKDIYITSDSIVFEFRFQPGVDCLKVDAMALAKFFLKLAVAVEMLADTRSSKISAPLACEIFDVVERYLSSTARSAVLVGQRLGDPSLIERASALRLWNAG